MTRLFPVGQCAPLLPAVAMALAVGCGPGKQEAETPVLEQTAADEIQRIGTTWRSLTVDKGMLSPPSAISLFRKVRKSEIVLEGDTAHETLTIDEELELRSGTQVACHTVVESELDARYGRKQGLAAVELTRPALSVVRQCNGMHPEPNLQEPANRALFVLRSDQLVAVEPPLEDRTYLPR